MRIRTGAFGQLCSLDFQYSITLSTWFDKSLCIKQPKINFICLLSFFFFRFISLFLKLNCVRFQLSCVGEFPYVYGVDVLAAQ